MANPYSEAWSRGEVAKDQQAPLYGYAAGGAAGIAAAHYVGNVKIPDGGYKNALTAAKTELTGSGNVFKAVSDGAGKLNKPNISVNDAIKGLGEQAKDLAKNEAKDAAKSLTRRQNLLRAGKWGAVAGAALVTGTVVAGVAGERIKRRAQRDELAAQSWVGYEESRRGMGGGLAR